MDLKTPMYAVRLHAIITSLFGNEKKAPSESKEQLFRSRKIKLHKHRITVYNSSSADKTAKLNKEIIVNFGRFKQTEKHWQQRQGNTVRFERTENMIDDMCPGLGSRSG